MIAERGEEAAMVFGVPPSAEKEATAAGEVAKVVLEEVTPDDPSFRYVVGKDAQRIMDTRKYVSDKHFKEWMMENFGLA